jgi:predicted AlkP superfamily pyrophosphatase or phosphodiesterase
MPKSLLAFVTVLLLLLVPIRPAPAETPAAAPKPADRIVCMISLDGLAAYYLDDPKADVPTLRALAADGARAASMKASVPTVTWPNHTTLVTGVNPQKHGVVGNNFYDRAAGQRVGLIYDPVLDKDQIVKVPTLYDLAKQAGMTTAAVRWPCIRNAHTLDWALPENNTNALLAKYVTPALQADAKTIGIDITPPEAAKAGTEGPPSDAACTKIFNELVLKKYRPGFALLHLVNIDHTEHFRGPRSKDAYEAIHTVDGQVKEVWDALKKNYGDKVTLFIVSDHGFSPIEKAILPNIVLKQAGLVTVEGKKVTGGSVQLVTQGGAAMLYITDEAHRDEIVGKIKAAFKDVKGVSKIVGPDELNSIGVATPAQDPHAPDVILFCDEGLTFGDTAAGDLPFNEKPERLGTHGHDPTIPDLHATFIAWGDGINKGVKLGDINNTDVAPTIAALMDLKLPDADGKVLNEILTTKAPAK